MKYYLINEEEADTIKALTEDCNERIRLLMKNNIPQDGTQFSPAKLDKLLQKLDNHILRLFTRGKTTAYVKKENNEYVIYHYYDNSLQYRYSYDNLRDAIEDLKCLESEFE